jgi:hypothetical protein
MSPEEWYAQKYGQPLESGEDDFSKIISIESNGKHRDAQGNLITSSAGAKGITQIMPATAKDPGYGITPLQDESEEEYTRVGKEYFNAMLEEFDGDKEKAAAAYNTGPGNLQKALKRAEETGGDWKQFVADETKQYVTKFNNLSTKTSSPKEVVNNKKLSPEEWLKAKYPSELQNGQEITLNFENDQIGEVRPLPTQESSFNVEEAQDAFGINPATQARATGFAKGLFEDPINAVMQFSGPEERARITRLDEAYQIQREKAGVTGFDFPRLAGNIASPMTLGGASAGAVLGGKMFSASTKLKTMFNPKVIEGAGAAIGGGAFLPVQSADEETDQFILDKLAQTGVSAILGGGFAKVIAGLTPTLKAGAAEQIARGVKVAPGHAYEGVPGWVYRQIDNVLTLGESLSNPVRLSFVKSSADEVLSGIGGKVPAGLKDGQEVVKYTNRVIGKYYDDALGDINLVNLDNAYINGVKATMARAKGELNKQEYKQFQQFVEGNLKSKLKNMKDGLEVDGQQLKQLDRFFKGMSQKFKNATDYRGMSLHLLYKDLGANNSAFISRVDPTGRVRAADAAFEKLVRVSKSSEAASGRGGNFSPLQLMKTSTSQANSTIQGGAGNAPLQSFSKKAMNVIGGEEDKVALTYRSLAVGSRIVSGSALMWASPVIAVPIMVAGGLSYAAAKALLKTPSKARIFMEKSLQKVSPRIINSIVTRALEEEATGKEE